MCIQAKQAAITEQRRAERQSAFQPPAPAGEGASKGNKLSGVSTKEKGEEVDVPVMKKKFSKALKKVSNRGM